MEKRKGEEMHVYTVKSTYNKLLNELNGDDKFL